MNGDRSILIPVHTWPHSPPTPRVASRWGLVLALTLAACGSLAPTAEERAACADAIEASEGIDVGGVSPNWDVRVGSGGRSVTLSYPGSGARLAVECVLRDGMVRSVTTAGPRGIAPPAASEPDGLDI